MRITLDFAGRVNGKTPYQLEHVFFEPLTASASSRISVRGRALAAPSTGTTHFQWTSAVQAMALLFVKAKLFEHSHESYCSATLTGQRGSLVSSLDYALSKQPKWLSDMFGTRGGGYLLLRSMIDRSNPEGKRPGPISLRIRRNLFGTGDIIIKINSTVATELELQSIVSDLEGIQLLSMEAYLVKGGGLSKSRICSLDEFLAHEKREGPLPVPFNKPEWHQGLRNLYRNELLTRLASSDLLGSAAEQQAYDRIVEGCSLRRTGKTSRSEVLKKGANAPFTRCGSGGELIESLHDTENICGPELGA